MIPTDFRNYSNQRPSSEFINSRNVYSEHSEQLNNWYEDLQRYEKSLEAMAAATLDQNFKEELQHVDQWFCYLSDAERTATMYTLLQHSSPVQTRFFMNILQQQKRDSILTLSDQETSPFHQAEKEASQRLMNMIPYKTGHPKTTPALANYNRHSIAFGDTDDYSRFPASSSTTSLSSAYQMNAQQLAPPTHSTSLASPRAYPRSTRSRPSSGIDIDSSPDFFSSWRSSMVGDRASMMERPKSPEGNNDSTTSLVSGNGSNSGFQPWGSTPSFNDLHISYTDKPLPRIATVAENDDEEPFRMGSFGSNPTTPPVPPAKMTFAMSTSTSSSTSTSLSPASAFAKYYSATSYRPSSSPSSPKPTATDKNYGAFLEPKDAWADDCFSDHSEASHRSNRSKKPTSKPKDKKPADLTVDMDLLNDVPAWLRSLRLHKYNTIFAPMRWQDIIQLSDQDLQDKGVAALGARRKMIKVFETIQAHCKTNDTKHYLLAKSYTI